MDHDIPDCLEVVQIIVGNAVCRVGDENVDVVAEAIAYCVGNVRRNCRRAEQRCRGRIVRLRGRERERS